MTFPIAGRGTLFLDGGFDPNDYPGLIADWNVDNATVVLGNITEIVSASGPGGALRALGTVAYDATGWRDGTPAAMFNNTTAKAFYADAGFGGLDDWTSFHVLGLDSDVPVLASQAVAFVGEWGNGDVFGVNALRSFGDGFSYRQGVGVLDYLPLAVAGVQVWCLESRGGVFSVYRGSVLQDAGVTTATASTAITVCGFTTDGVTPNGNSSPVGPYKRGLHYEGAMVSGDRDAIIAGLEALYPAA